MKGDLGVFSTCAPSLGGASRACHPDLDLVSGPPAQVVTWPGWHPPSVKHPQVRALGSQQCVLHAGGCGDDGLYTDL